MENEFLALTLVTDDGAESKFGTHKKLIVLNIFNYKHCVNKSRDMSGDDLLKIVNY